MDAAHRLDGRGPEREGELTWHTWASTRPLLCGRNSDHRIAQGARYALVTEVKLVRCEGCASLLGGHPGQPDVVSEPVSDKPWRKWAAPQSWSPE